VQVVKLLATKDYCAPEILREIARTPAMRRRMKEVGFIPSNEDDPRRFRRERPTRSREVLSKFGVELPKPPRVEPVIPPEVWIGSRRPDALEIRISRQELLDRVWSTPVDTLAGEWGLSGRGLAKACARVNVPVPPRGYWARLKAGQRPRRPRLPSLKRGEAEVIVVWENAPGAPQT
jgi:hypothetical protein